MPNPHLQRHIWYPRVTLIPMVMEDITLRSRYLMKAMLKKMNKT